VADSSASRHLPHMGSFISPTSLCIVYLTRKVLSYVDLKENGSPFWPISSPLDSRKVLVRGLHTRYVKLRDQPLVMLSLSCVHVSELTEDS
jgi:hypothetical protein